VKICKEIRLVQEEDNYEVEVVPVIQFEFTDKDEILSNIRYGRKKACLSKFISHFRKLSCEIDAQEKFKLNGIYCNLFFPTGATLGR
jgi:hypothetical protein